MASYSLRTQGWTPGLRSGAQGSPLTRTEGEDSAWRRPTPSTPEAIAQKSFTASWSTGLDERGLSIPCASLPAWQVKSPRQRPELSLQTLKVRASPPLPPSPGPTGSLSHNDNGLFSCDTAPLSSAVNPQPVSLGLPLPGGFIAPASGSRPYLDTGAGAPGACHGYSGPSPSPDWTVSTTWRWVLTNISPSTLLRGCPGGSGTHTPKSERKIQKVPDPLPHPPPQICFSRHSSDAPSPRPSQINNLSSLPQPQLFWEQSDS